MHPINKSRNWVVYAVITTLALAGIFPDSAPTLAIADTPGITSPPDTIPIDGGGDTTGHGSSIESGDQVPANFDWLMLVIELTILNKI